MSNLPEKDHWEEISSWEAKIIKMSDYIGPILETLNDSGDKSSSERPVFLGEEIPEAKVIDINDEEEYNRTHHYTRKQKEIIDHILNNTKSF